MRYKDKYFRERSESTTHHQEEEECLRLLLFLYFAFTSLPPCLSAVRCMSCGLSILRANHLQLLFISRISHCRPQNIEPAHFYSVNKWHFLANNLRVVILRIIYEGENVVMGLRPSPVVVLHSVLLETVVLLCEYLDLQDHLVVQLYHTLVEPAQVPAHLLPLLRQLLGDIQHVPVVQQFSLLPPSLSV